MPLLQSVFCLQGYDDRNRFFALSGISLLAFIIFSAVFSNYFIVNVLFLLLLTVVVTLTTIRRLRDAKLSKNWQFVPSTLFFITGITTLLLNNSVSYYLLLIPSITSALLLTYPSTRNGKPKNYIYGYYGPIDLNHYQQNSHNAIVNHQRIEPTLVSDGANSHFVEHSPLTAQVEQNVDDQFEPKNKEQNQTDIGELIRLKLLTNKKLQLGLIACVSVVLLAVFITSVFTKETTKEQVEHSEQIDNSVQQQAISTSNLIANKQHYLAMPDNFDLYLTSHQGILLHWQADEVSNGHLWSQLTVQGDKSCQIINFNKGNDFRPLTVEVENSTEYFASFSPLDTQAIIKALAFRGSFSLCGYDFSLKGTQAVLGKHNNYAHYLEK